MARAVPVSPTFAVVAGSPAELVCIAGRSAVVVVVKNQDQWGSPTPARRDVQMTRDGACLFAKSPSLKLSCRSNPIPPRDRKLKHFWGDLHAQSDATVGTGTEEEYFRFARDVAFLDFCSHQGNDFQVTDEDWRRLNDQCRAFHEDGKFVVFPGWEWSGNTPAGGDRNVIFLDEDQPIWRSSHWQVPHIPEDDQSPAP